MDEKNQIEEMALEIAKLFCNPKGCYNCNLCDAYGSLELSCEEYLSYRRMASVLYAAGYRKQSGWISVDERLPKYGGSILIHTIEDTFRIAWRDNDNCYISGLTLYEPEGVDCWMPIPELPKGE